MSSGPFDADSFFACPLVWLGVAGVLAMGVLAALTVEKWRKPILALLLITVISVLAIPVLLPGRSICQAPTPRTVAFQRLKRLAIALIMYREDSDRHLPPTLGHLFPYVDEGDAFVTRSSGTPEPSTREDVDRGQCDFLYFGADLPASTDTSDVVVATTKPRTLAEEGYLCVLHLGGHVEVHTAIPQDVREVWNKHELTVPESRE